MSLDQKALDLITAKDCYLEAYWLGPDVMLYVLAGETHTELWQWGKGSPELLSAELPLGSALPFGGKLALCKDSQAYALGLDHKLYNLTLKTHVELPGPASDLTITAAGNLTFVGFDTATKLDNLYQMVDGFPVNLWSSAEFIRHLDWHPETAECVFLSWARDALPWHSAGLVHLDLSNSLKPHLMRLAPPGMEATPCAEVCYSPNGKFLAASFLTGNFFQLWIYRFETRNWVQLTFDSREKCTPLRRSSRRNFAFLNDTLIVSSSSEKGYWQLETIDFRGHARSVKTYLTHLANIQAETTSGKVLMLAAGIDYPQQLVQLAPEGPSWVTHRHGPKLSSRLRSESITWATDSGETVHGILYRDPNAKALSPLIIPIHGGPTDAVHATWPAKALAFVQQGYAVLYVNYRGSWGYGYDYHQSLRGHWGVKEIHDCVGGVRSLAALGWIDPERVGLWGGGTASFTVLWALINRPDIFHCGIAVFPIIDLVHHLAHCSEAERVELIWALGSSDPKSLASKSPFPAMANLRRPIGFFAGDNDRLLDTKKLQSIADDLKSKRVPCWLSLYQGEGRQWRKHSTYVDYYSKVSGFFDRFLRFRGPE